MRESRVVEEMLTAMEAAQSSMNNANGSAIIKESLDNVRAMLAAEDRGWDIFIGGNGSKAGGLNLDDLRAWADRIHESSLSGWMKRGFSLRSAYIWQDGIHYDKVPAESRGKGTNVQDKIDDPRNQRSFFSKQARVRREKRLYAEGLALWVGEDSTKLLDAVPLEQITDYLSDPDDPSIIMAYRRKWQHRKDDGTFKEMTRWYYVDTYKDQAKDFITVSPGAGKLGVKEEVEKGWTAFDQHANSVEGWAFGFPDALGAWIWNNYAKQAYMDGLDVSEAMASLIFKASTASGKGSQNAAVQFASPQGAGSTAAMGAGSDVAALSTAGKAFDFSQIREIIAVIASSLDVSNIALTSNPGDAGSSYGSAATLDEPGRLTTTARRDEHIDLDLRVLRWMAGKEKAKDIKVFFLPISDAAEQYRRMQTVTLPWLQGIIDDAVYKDLITDVLGMPGGALGATPKGMLLPNNKASLPRKDIDGDGTAASTAAPTQGKSSGSDDTGRPTDTRSDIQAK